VWRAAQHEQSRDWDWLPLKCGFLEGWIEEEDIKLNVRRGGGPRSARGLTQSLYCYGFGVAGLSPVLWSLWRA